MLLVQKCKQGKREKEKKTHWRLGLNCFTKNHGEMKGIIQMTILESLVHLYEKLWRCCRDNNIKIVFFSPLFFCSSWRALKGSFCLLSLFLLWWQVPPPSPHTETCEVTHKQPGKQHQSAAQPADWKLTWEIMTGRNKKKKKKTPHIWHWTACTSY